MSGKRVTAKELFRQAWADHGNPTRRGKLKATERAERAERSAVVLYLLDQARTDGAHAEGGIPSTALMTGVAERTVRDIVKRLIAEGWLAVQQRGGWVGGKHPHGVATLYQLTIPERLRDRYAPPDRRKAGKGQAAQNPGYASGETGGSSDAAGGSSDAKPAYTPAPSSFGRVGDAQPTSTNPSSEDPASERPDEQNPPAAPGLVPDALTEANPKSKSTTDRTGLNGAALVSSGVQRAMVLAVHDRTSWSRGDCEPVVAHLTPELAALWNSDTPGAADAVVAQLLAHHRQEDR